MGSPITLKTISRFDESECQEIASKYLSGMMTTAIGKEHGCGNNTIRFLLTHMGVEMRKLGAASRADITGQRFGRLTAIKDTGNASKNKNRIWEFQCDCGNRIQSTPHAVKSGNTNSCGCYGKDRVAETQRLDVIGQTYGDLTAIRFSHNQTKANGNKGSAWYVWRCACGHEKAIAATTVQARFKKNGWVSCQKCATRRSADSRKADFVGKRFGMLVGIEQIDLHKSPAQAKWLWRCDCGNITERHVTNARTHHNANCGCSRVSTAADRTGERFGALVALRNLGKLPGERTYTWEFQCDCGNTCNARLRDAVSGLQKSCGCRQGGYDSIAGWLAGEFRNAEEEAFFYVFPLARFDGFVKPGIAEDIASRKRASRGEYGEIHDFIALSRLDAWLIEQALLTSTRLMAQCPSELADRKWEGYTEVRKMNPKAVFDMALELHDQLQALGRESFAIQHLPTTPMEQKMLQSKAAQPVAA